MEKDVQRTLVSLTFHEKPDEVYISFGYYDQHWEFTGVSEDVRVTSSELYGLLKSKLVLRIRHFR